MIEYVTRVSTSQEEAGLFVICIGCKDEKGYPGKFFHSSKVGVTERNAAEGKAWFHDMHNLGHLIIVLTLSEPKEGDKI